MPFSFITTFAVASFHLSREDFSSHFITKLFIKETTTPRTPVANSIQIKKQHGDLKHFKHKIEYKTDIYKSLEKREAIKLSFFSRKELRITTFSYHNNNKIYKFPHRNYSFHLNN